ncbi:Pyruvate/Phosphoenolpyruvate kinase-like domain-containing protein [Mycena metata]|uniref:Pyruvate/Phosphoenolpyruvate kinase-like domain-containing protein n=1 Tax=Mycena metata TaxID=1033252 RepID=A0AAD7JSB1_9AGAR|nr:Pyruvate/Phosphoenolpyruvate kinase-like domain-containing protein [Mycena metata]
MAAHPLLNAFKANKPAFGVWLTSPGFFHARTVAQASPKTSWVLVDCEHGLTSLNPVLGETIAAIHGARAEAPSALVRIASTGVSSSTSWQIKHALDAGARGVLVPMVSTAEKAAEVVADSRFPPGGRRGFGSSYTHGNWGPEVSVAEYLATANDTIVVMVQIETKEGLANVEAIAQVDGIDVLFIGPYDLSIALGYSAPAPDPHPDVEKIIQHIREVVQKAGRKCAIFCTDGKQAAKRAAEGFDMINVTSDVGALSSAIFQHLAVAAEAQEG